MSDPRILVAIGQGVDIGDVQTVILGLSEATWADLENGNAQDIDLRKLGIPATVLVMRGTDHEDIKRQLQEAAKDLQVPIGGLADLSIQKPRVS